jgi:valyl-tRNA synthetase
MKEIIRAVRNIRAEADAAPSRKLSVFVKADKEQTADEVRALASHIQNLAGVSSVTVVPDERDVPEESVSAILEGMIVYVPAGDLLDYAAEREKLEKEKIRLSGEIARLSAKLANEGFTAKAPEKVVAAEREKLAAAKSGLEKVLARAETIKEKQQR